MNEFHRCGAERWSIYGMETGRIEMTSPQNADNQCINGLDSDCDHGHEKIHARRCVLVDAYASHPVLLSVTASYRSLCPSSTTLKLNQSLNQTTIRTRTLTLDRRQKRQMRLMTCGTNVRQHKSCEDCGESVCACRTGKVGTGRMGMGKMN